MTNWAYGVFLGLIFAAIIIGVLEWAGKDRRRVVHDAPMDPDNFTRKELKAAMAFPLRMKERTLEVWEEALIASIKEAEAEIIELIEAQFSTGGCNDRWLAIAKTDLQKGFMAFVRAVAKPGSDSEFVKKPHTAPTSEPPKVLHNVDVVHNEDGEVLAVKDPEGILPKDEPCLGAEVRRLGLGGEGEGNYD